MSGSHSFNYHEYYNWPADHEYHVIVPTLTDDPSEDRIRLFVSKVGGGTVGKRYEGHWAYAVYVDGRECKHGDDLRTGTPKTHAEVARVLAGFLSEDGIRIDSDRLALFEDEGE